MLARLLFIITLLATVSCSPAPSELQPFVSDGCSAFPEGTFRQQELWLDCCTEHDFAYWKGGTVEEREAADVALQSCVAAVGEPEVATLMLAGVRVGGSPYFPTAFRWGYGWPYFRGYGALTEEENRLVSELRRAVTTD